MTRHDGRRITDDLLRPLTHTSATFWVVVAFLGLIVASGLGSWLYQMYWGFGVSGVRWPVFWALPCGRISSSPLS